MLSYPFVFVISIVAGFVGSMSGMGGGVVLIPVLTFFGMPIKKAIAISIISVIATSSGSASAYVRDHLTNLKIGMFLEMFTIVGAMLGALATSAANQRFLFIAFGIVLFGSWMAIYLQRHEEWEPRSPGDPLSKWLELHGTYLDRASGETVQYQAVRASWGAVGMLGAGFIAGLLGIGAGALKVLVHDLIMGLPPKVSTTTSNLIIGVTALAGASVYLSQGLIEPGLAAPVVIGVVAGAFLGTKVLVRLQNKAVRRFFLAVLAVLGIEMLVRGVRG